MTLPLVNEYLDFRVAEIFFFGMITQVIIEFLLICLNHLARNGYSGSTNSKWPLRNLLMFLRKK